MKALLNCYYYKVEIFEQEAKLCVIITNYEWIKQTLKKMKIGRVKATWKVWAGNCQPCFLTMSDWLCTQKWRRCFGEEFRFALTVYVTLSSSRSKKLLTTKQPHSVAFYFQLHKDSQTKQWNNNWKGMKSYNK